MKAIWHGEVIAESDKTQVVVGRHYFPPESVDQRYLEPARARSLCWWKGIARYYSVGSGERRSRNAAWAYHRPLPWIRKIRDHVAFWGDVKVVE